MIERLGTPTPRLAHRIGFRDSSVWIAGVAAQGDDSNLIESIVIVRKT